MKYFYVGFATLVLASLPQISLAYQVVDSEVSRISDTVTLYTLEMEFGFGNADMWMPIAASKETSFDVTTEGTKTASIILSTSTITGTQYFVPAGQKGRFTLMVLERHEAGEFKPTLTVEKLPIWLQRKSEKKSLRVFSGDELKGFVAR